EAIAIHGSQINSLAARSLSWARALNTRVLMGMAISEIAQALELTESAVMTRVFRARAQLKERAAKELI
ncbi:MAG: sigma factor-like helix-turn-helix DNA-binding protein, partial [Pseudomonadota bacterium]